MPDTYTSTLMHLIWSTKNRRELITPEVEPDLFAYIGGICRGVNSPLLAAGGTANHVHLLVSLSKNISLADLLLNIKRDSSRWMHKRVAGFEWQEGYGGFSLGQSQVERVRLYIARQKQHHQRRTFEEEFIAFLDRYRIAYDRTTVWR